MNNDKSSSEKNGCVWRGLSTAEEREESSRGSTTHLSVQVLSEDKGCLLKPASPWDIEFVRSISIERASKSI